MQWGFGYLSRQFCACQRAVRCASVGWSLPDAAICHPDWRRIGSDVWAGKSWPQHRAPTSSAAGQKLLRGCHAAWRRTSSSRNSAPYTQLNRWGLASQRDMNAIIAECSSSVELNTPRRKTLAESC